MNFKKLKSLLLETSHIKNEVSSLTSFRWLTAFTVFLFHCKIHLGYNFGLKIIDKFLSNGAVFMTGFFVLSGYIMCFVYINKDFRKKTEIYNFYIKRFARIYPVYLIATITYFIFITPEIPYSKGDWIRIIVNDLFLVQAFFPNMFQLGINGGTWSISVEAFFYLLFPLILVLFSKRSHILFIIAMAASLIITINVVTENYGSVSNNIKTFYSNPVMRVSEFMIGISFYLLQAKGKLKNLPKFLKSSVFVFFLIFCLTCLKFSEGPYSYMGLQYFITPLFGLLIFNFHNIKYGPIANNKVINYLGKISYSFYMWQFLAIELGRYLKEHYDTNSWLLMLSALSLNIILSSVSYHLIEERCRSILMKKIKIKK